MNLRDTYSVIPESYRKKGVLISLSLFLRAVLDFAGVAVFIPVLARVLEKGDVQYVILKVRLLEVSVVTFPAYTETAVTARKAQLTDHRKRHLELWKARTLAKLKGEEM